MLRHFACALKAVSPSTVRCDLVPSFEKSSACPVPEGHATIGQGFNLGWGSDDIVSPEAGRLRCHLHRSTVPSSGLNPIFRTFPNVETLGYCQESLRDEEQNPSGIARETVAQQKQLVRVHFGISTHGGLSYAK